MIVLQNPLSTVDDHPTYHCEFMMLHDMICVLRNDSLEVR